MASRMAAAQSGGTASFPNRIARNVLPQMSAHATKVTATRMLTTLERPSGTGCEERANCCERRALSDWTSGSEAVYFGYHTIRKAK